MNSDIAVNIPIQSVFDNTSILPLYHVQTYKYSVQTNLYQSPTLNEKISNTNTNLGENNC